MSHLDRSCIKHHRPKTSSSKHYDSSDNSDDSSLRHRRRKQDKRAKRREKEAEKKARKRMKESETPEQRRERCLRERARRDEILAAESRVCGYTDTNNPFGDNNLSEPLIWTKKLKSIGKTGRNAERKERKRLKHHRKNVECEIEEIGRRRNDRADEKEQLDELREQLARDAEREMNADWDRREDDFVQEQSRTRSKIRIRDNRQRPIDVLAKNLFVMDRAERKNRPVGHGDKDNEEDLEVDLFDPCDVFTGLEVFELQQLTIDIEEHIALGVHLDYWQALVKVCADQLYAAQNESARIHSSVATVRTDIESLLQGKTLKQLAQIQHQAKIKLSSNGSNDAQDVVIDVDYWEALSGRLEVFIAKAFLREFHNKLLQSRLDELEDDLEPDFATEIAEKLEAKYESMPPSTERVVPKLEVYEKEEEEEEKGPIAGPDDWVDEENFAQTVALPDEVYAWHDKYRPRKPLFFNKVKIGFEWSKYNQTHYDRDNPPPKVVQGYKFNIFYPDLIDISVPPVYSRHSIPDSPDFCILRFRAGPPYEDIAFKIVKKEWESRRGLKCKFEKGTLFLHFSFKRYRYRR